MSAELVVADFYYVITMNKINERKTALDILTDIKSGTPSQTALQNMAVYAKTDAVTSKKQDKKEECTGIADLDKRSRSFITRLVYGTLENYLYLDFIISEFTGKPVTKLKPFIATLLELSVYQLLFMDSVPEHAAVNEAVRIVQNSPQRGLKGFVNGVLRNVVRNRDNLPEPEGDEKHKFSVTYSIPEFIVDIISDELHMLEYNNNLHLKTSENNKSELRDSLVDTPISNNADTVHEKTETVLRALRKPRPLTIRCNTSLISPDKLRERLVSEMVNVHQDENLPEYVMFISGFDSLESLDSFKEGFFYVQDTGSILSGAVSDYKPGERVLDLCGAPGGKAIGAALAGAVVETGDISGAKTDLIKENIARLKLDNINVNVRDATIFDPSLENAFDAVICDVPCSGIGIIGRKPDICINLTPERIESLIPLQRRILETAVKYVKPGGRLIYSTCTVNRRENEENGKLLEKMRFETVFEKQWLPGIEGSADGFYTKILKK